MYDPRDFRKVGSHYQDLSLLPNAEDELHEYKSSKIDDKSLIEKVTHAASAFWNSGGGLFVAGVDGEGKPDGGLSPKVGRQSRRDWLDQVIAKVNPSGAHAIQSVVVDSASGNSVFLITFGVSENPPHMAPDNRYYIRAGAHTVAASHFLVEALFARRDRTTPIIKHSVRRKPTDRNIFVMGIFPINNAPALNVKINFDPIPEIFKPNTLPLEIPVISRDVPFFFDLCFRDFSCTADVEFFDTLGNRYKEKFNVCTAKQAGPDFSQNDMERAVEKIADRINMDPIKASLDNIANAIRDHRR